MGLAKILAAWESIPVAPYASTPLRLTPYAFRYMSLPRADTIDGLTPCATLVSSSYCLVIKAFGRLQGCALRLTLYA